MPTSDKTYNWQRYWVSREGVLAFTDHGFIPEIDESRLGLESATGILRFEQIAAMPCLALLGEPGIGKTKSLEQLPAASDKAVTLRRDLSSYGTDALLYKAIFEATEFQSWINSVGTLEIVLDSLDECLVHVRTVARLLVEELAKYPRSRLRLRIACRTAEWPQLLTDELPKLWGDGNFGAYELAPLTRRNVAEAASAEGLNPETFLSEIDRRDIAALAMKPITLRFLLQLRHDLPSTQTELYRKGCLLLSSYENSNRLAWEGPSELTAAERLAVAERVAAVTMFSKRSAIFIGDNESEAAHDDLRLSELAVGSEYIDQRTLPVTPRVVAGAIRSGLFTGRTGPRMGWAHWTFAEFLAASYLVRNDFTKEQMNDLIMHPDSRSTVVPQLRETAASLAALNPKFLNGLIATDPQVLLASKIMSADSSTRERLTEAILKVYADQGDAARDRNFSPRLDVLQHPGLDKQLAPYVLDKQRSAAVRRIVLDIIDACSVTGLFDDLVQLALDSTESWHLRHDAAFTISRLGSDDQKHRLKSLLNTTPEEDPEDELRGDALLALWPKFLTTEEALAEISRERHGTLYGTYSIFVVTAFPDGLTEADLPVALQWAATHPPKHGFGSEYGLGGKIMRRAWDHLDNPSVLLAFAQVAISRIRNFDEWFERNGARSDVSLIDAPQDRRLAILRAIVEQACRQKMKLPRFWAMEARLISRDDLDWLVEELRRCASQPQGPYWAQLVRSAFDSDRSDHIELILATMPGLPPLADVFAGVFEPVELGSTTAVEQKRSHDRRLQAMSQSKGATLRPISERANQLLDEFERGDTSAWWRLNFELARSERPSDAEFVADLESLPSWSELDNDLRRRCVAAAARYVLDADANTSQWLGTSTLYRPAAAGYRALRLLFSEDPTSVAELDTKTWQNWAGIILAFPEAYGKAEIETTRTLVSLAYEGAPEAVKQALDRLIDKENAERGSVFVLRKMDKCIDEKFVQMLESKVTNDQSLKPQVVGEILRQLLTRDRRLGIRVAVKFLRQLQGVEPKDNRVEAAKALLEAAPSESWVHVWSAVETDPDFGKQLFAEIAGESHISQSPKLSTALDPKEVAILFRWLERMFPHTEDPKVQGGHAVGSRENIGHYRDALLTGLRERGTKAAVEALRKLAHDLPQISWLAYIAADAERQRLRSSWEGVEPSVLYKLAAGRRERLVESADDLLERVLESLARLQSLLRGETPAVPDLWNNDKPKDESHLSNYIKRHFLNDLAGQGIIPNREVQVRMGEFTDIHIDAIRMDTRGGSYDVVSVIVESKGCWNQGVKKSMKTQLRDRYLTGNGCRHGVYIVGWFLCPKWNPQDYRRRQTPKLSIERAKQFFANQAEELSTDGFTLRAFVLDATLE